jgi:hypothetical protein
MALWGNKDTKSVTGTLALTLNSAAVVGTGTAFTTALQVGQRIITPNGEYQIAAIATDTALTLTKVYAGTTASGLTVTANEKPVYLDDAEASATFGVDVAEAAVTPQLTQSGWVLQTTGTGGRAGRVSFETLVAMKTISGDAEDTAFPDA